MTHHPLFSRSSIAIYSGAHTPSISRLIGVFAALLGLLLGSFLLGGCSALPDKPVRASMYDFGPSKLTPQLVSGQAPLENLPPLAIDDVSTPGGVLDNMAVLYRLAYQDAQELRPYALARWTMPPAQLVRQRLRERRFTIAAGTAQFLTPETAWPRTAAKTPCCPCCCARTWRSSVICSPAPTPAWD